MLVATCLFVCQDSTTRILLKAYPATEIAFARYFVHTVLVGVFIAWRDPRLMISRRPLVQMLRSSFLLGATLPDINIDSLIQLNGEFESIVTSGRCLNTCLKRHREAS
jgi:hypothetical protein